MHELEHACACEQRHAKKNPVAVISGIKFLVVARIFLICCNIHSSSGVNTVLSAGFWEPHKIKAADMACLHLVLKSRLHESLAFTEKLGKIIVLTSLEIYAWINNSGMFVSISIIMLKIVRLLQNV